MTKTDLFLKNRILRTNAVFSLLIVFRVVLLIDVPMKFAIFSRCMYTRFPFGIYQVDNLKNPEGVARRKGESQVTRVTYNNSCSWGKREPWVSVLLERKSDILVIGGNEARPR